MRKLFQTSWLAQVLLEWLDEARWGAAVSSVKQQYIARQHMHATISNHKCYSFSVLHVFLNNTFRSYYWLLVHGLTVMHM
jgi:hypothetical protein